jgi:hypothetical protein
MTMISCSEMVLNTLPAGKRTSTIEYMDKRFQHMYASPQFLSVFARLPTATKLYTASSGTDLSTALLFHVSGPDVIVLNEQIVLGKEEIERFVQFVFEQNPCARRVLFPAISPHFQTLACPYSATLWTSDIVLSLPKTEAEYRASLGKSTRSSLKRYSNKIRKEHPSFQFEVIPSGRVDAALIDTLLSLNKARIEKRNQAADIGQNDTRCMQELLEKCGFVALIKIQNEIVAGAVNFQFGSNYFLHLLSHDSRFDRYGLGTLCCFLGICECIRRGGSEYHFLWGQYEYKYRLLGEQRDFAKLTIYRSAFQKFVQSGLDLNPRFANTRYLVKDWVIRKSLRRDSSKVTSMLLFDVLHAARSFRRSAAALRAALATSRKAAAMDRQ